MTDRKISELTNITGANLADADEFVVVDASADETKAITFSELKEAFDTGTGFVRITGDTMTGALDVQSTITADGLTVDGDISATGGNVDLDTLDLKAIAATKGVTAVDVFVYDTSKDSDGGAWRKRTQGTSWYQEALNTATRGSRKEFPAVAVIVAEATKVTIYDGDDPALPMWMVLNQTNAGPVELWRFGRNATSLAGFNGSVCIGTSLDSNAGLLVLDFVADRTSRRSALSNYGFGIILNRNSGATLPVASADPIVSANVNDVAMTVLPDAPIDPATGLQVPTIAVGTAGGVSVIKDDGTVTDAVNVGTYNFVAFTGQGLFVGDDTILEFATYADIKSGDGWGDIVANTSGTADWTLPARIRTDFIAVGNDLAGCGNTAPKSMQLINPDTSDFTKTMTSVVSPTYNTGWMNGDIKGAFLSDTDDTDLVGSGELVTNGTFDTDTSGWTAENANVSGASVAGQLEVTNNGVGWFYQAIPTVIGQTYRITGNFVTKNSGGRVYIGTSIGNASYTAALNPLPFALDFVATTTTAFISLGDSAGGTGVVNTYDNISVQLVDADRSVNNNGLTVNGTVTRTPVATGAELVGYTFATTYYLRGFSHGVGAGDFSAIAWYKPLDTNTQVIANFVNSDLSNEEVPLVIISGNLNYEIGGLVNTGIPVPAGQWSLLEVSRKNGVINASVNALRGYSAANTTDFSANLDLLVGVNRVLGNPADGSLALLRISATAPTAEQIKKIYEDEKVLFQENAACTLYGASDAVTALAHDDELGLLHVGTSAGRSVFQGLRRVSNTTTAVGTAISASNGLVVEE